MNPLHQQIDKSTQPGKPFQIGMGKLAPSIRGVGRNVRAPLCRLLDSNKGERSDSPVLGELTCVLDIHAETAGCILDLAVSENDLNAAQIADGPVSDGRLCLSQGIGAISASH